MSAAVAGPRGDVEAVALLVILVVGVVVRLAFAARVPVLVDGDASHYYEPTHALLSGQGSPLPLARQPLYPAFIALPTLVLGKSLKRLGGDRPPAITVMP